MRNGHLRPAFRRPGLCGRGFQLSTQTSVAESLLVRLEEMEGLAELASQFDRLLRQRRVIDEPYRRPRRSSIAPHTWTMRLFCERI